MKKKNIITINKKLVLVSFIALFASFAFLIYTSFYVNEDKSLMEAIKTAFIIDKAPSSTLPGKDQMAGYTVYTHCANAEGSFNTTDWTLILTDVEKGHAKCSLELFEPVNLMVADQNGYGTPFLGGPINKNEIYSIIFENHINVPEGATFWDVSEQGNGKVLAWFTPENNWEVHIGQKDGVLANKNSSHLFANNSSYLYDFTHFITTTAEDMNHMFYQSSFSGNYTGYMDATNVLDMSYMFANSQVGDFTIIPLQNESKVRTMAHMFESTQINNATDNLFFGDLSMMEPNSLKTPYLEDMSYMFAENHFLRTFTMTIQNNSLKTTAHMFERSGIQTFNPNFTLNYYMCMMGECDYYLEDISDMFNECGEFANFGEDSWNKDLIFKMLFSPVLKNASGMFRGCRQLTSFEFLSFQGYRVETMEEMFAGCERLTSFLLPEIEIGWPTPTKIRMFEFEDQKLNFNSMFAGTAIKDLDFVFRSYSMETHEMYFFTAQNSYLENLNIRLYSEWNDVAKVRMSYILDGNGMWGTSQIKNVTFENLAIEESSGVFYNSNNPYLEKMTMRNTTVDNVYDFVRDLSTSATIVLSGTSAMYNDQITATWHGNVVVE